MTSHITDHKGAALARLAQQLKGKPSLKAFYGAFAGRYQGVEDALWQLYTERWLDTAVGVQLDVLGRIIGQARGNSADDDAYRLRLRARQRVNRSSGTVEEILAVFVTLGLLPTDLFLEPSFPAGFTLYVDGIATDEDTATLYAEFLRDARLASVRVLLHTSPALATETFTLPSSTTLGASFAPTYPSSMLVASTAGFPAVGSVLLRYAVTGQQKRFRYASKTAGSLDGIEVKEGTSSSFAGGELVVGVPQPESELSDDYANPFPSSMPLKAGAFPDSGFVTLGYGTPDFRVFGYSSKTEESLEGVVAIAVGAGTSFLQGELVASCQLCLGSTEDDLGGELSSIREA